jgi:methyltransferase-like protein
MPEAHRTSYDEMPYSNNPFYHTHPDCLATVATLFGMAPPPVPRCRVLELGCAAGGNLIPMAFTLPDSRFVGVDLSPRQVAAGQALIDALGLKNIELRPLSILDVDRSFGEFDYIICHGVYSWVPTEVQDKILAICAWQLTSNGVAYISYNIYPGWHVGAMIREMLGYHLRRAAPPEEQVRQGRAFLDCLAGAVPDADSAYARLLKTEVERLRTHSDTYFFHEYLEEVNQPLYFHQFVERAAGRKLQYLGEARYNTMAGTVQPAELKSSRAPLPADLVAREQYLDFWRNRTFRRTLLCHDHVKLTRPPSAETMSNFLLSALARPVADPPDIPSGRPEEFRERDGDTTLTTASPVLKAAFVSLHEIWPRVISFDDLCALVRSRLEQGPGPGPTFGADKRRRLAEALLQYSLTNLVELHVHVPPFVADVSERPLASRLARLQAQGNADRVTNLLHRGIEIGGVDRLVLGALDGSRDRAALVEMLARLAAEGVLEADGGEPPGPDLGRVRQSLGEGLDNCLRQMASNALLVG